VSTFANKIKNQNELQITKLFSKKVKSKYYQIIIIVVDCCIISPFLL
jgi:hypothetical protein